MPGAVKYNGVSPNTLKWNLGDVSGPEFEKIIYGLLASSFSDNRDNVKILQTPASGDGGKDIIIESSDDLEIFGIPIHCSPGKTNKIYIECKLTSKPRVKLESFGKNFVQTKNESISHFILITNASITPNAYYLLSESFYKEGINFHVIDEFILVKYCVHNELNILKLPSIKDNYDNLIIEYQSEVRNVNGNSHIDLFIWVRSYACISQACRLFLQTDRNWIISEPERIFILGPNECSAFKIKAIRQFNDGMHELQLVLNFNKGHHVLRIPATTISLDFTPRLFGLQHYRIINDLIKILDDRMSLSIVSITGEAGTGKSRVVDEVIQRRKSSNIKYIRCHFEKNNLKKSLMNFAENSRNGLGWKISISGESDLNPGVIPRMVSEWDSDYFEAVIILEDLHHADNTIFDMFKSLLSLDRKNKSPLCIIMTGRNDFTFPNKGYFSLIDLIEIEKSKKHIYQYDLGPLPDQDARNLIRSTIENIPEYALQKIHSMGMNIPFNIVQCIEYLLEIKMVILLNRNTVGIPNVQKFSSKDCIPQSITDLFNLRYQELNSLKHKKEIRQFLLISSAFGFQIPQLVRDICFDGIPQEEIDKVMIDRRFIIQRTEGLLEWYHENLLLFFRNKLENEKEGKVIAKTIIDHPVLNRMFKRLDIGKFACIAKCYDKSLNSFYNLEKELSSIDNFSSENINSEYFTYIDYLFKARHKISPNSTLLKNMLLAKAYLGIHNLPLFRGIEACRDARAKITKLDIPYQEKYIITNIIKQLEGHAYLNIGWTNLAKKILLELECAVQISPDLQKRHDLTFDLYNRLQDLYRFYNHLSLAEEYGILASNVSKISNNSKLHSVGLIGTAALYTYLNTQKCIKLSKEALEYTKQHGTKRHVCLATLGLTSAEISYYQKDKGRLIKLFDKIHDVLESCLANNYSSAAVRTYNQLAALSYLIDPDSKKQRNNAIEYVKHGINASVKYGVGRYIWHLYNTSAIISSANKRSPDEVFKQFSTGIEYLRLESLLFLGNCDLLCGNLILISNYIKFLDRHDTEEHVYHFIKSLDFYRSNEFKSTDYYKWIVETVRNNHVIFSSKTSPGLLYDDKTGYSLTIF